jgi:hypothetical protein
MGTWLGVCFTLPDSVVKMGTPVGDEEQQNTNEYYLAG